MFKVVVTLLIFVGAALSESAAAQGVCAKRDDIVKQLTEKYQETRENIGITANVNIVEIFSPASGTWTILVTRPSGMSCIIATGESWEKINNAKRDTDL